MSTGARQGPLARDYDVLTALSAFLCLPAYAGNWLFFAGLARGFTHR